MKVDKIYCLFSVDQNYDQPDHNLVAWWADRPSIEQVADACGEKFPAGKDEITLAIVKIWGMEDRYEINSVQYRVDLIPAGKVK